MFFAELPDLEPTRATLHNYANGATALNRAHGIAHSMWWHVSLKPHPGGLVADAIPLPGGGALGIRMDMGRHSIVMETHNGLHAEFEMGAGATGSEMGDQILAAGAELGLEGDYDRSKFESDEATSYDPAHASAFHATLVNANTVFEKHRVGLDGSVGPIQVWPHGFDISFEWFGTRTEVHEGDELPSQLNLGLYPKDRAYFYSNPWPFEESLLGAELPHGAEWHTDGWQGSILYYDQIAGDPDADAKVAAYAAAVFSAVAPTLTA